MIEVINWIVENYTAMLAGAIGVLGGLLTIAKLTPNPKDDAIIAKILGWLKLIPVKK